MDETAAPPAREPEIIRHYHAHVYYDPAASRDRAALLRARLAARFPDVVIGSWHDEPVGPHSQAMYQVVFGRERLADILPWLMLNRLGLSILVHPGTGDGYADHIDHAVWLGPVAPVRLSAFRNRPD